MRISTHTSLAGRDSFIAERYSSTSISTHTSLTGRDTTSVKVRKIYSISTHTSLAGRDAGDCLTKCVLHKFLLTRPSRDVTRIASHSFCVMGFLLTRPSRDVTNPTLLLPLLTVISTHTSLAGRDQIRRVHCCSFLHFYSHVPRGT